MSRIHQSRRPIVLMALMAIGAGIQVLGEAHASTDGVPAMYATKAEAEAAAKKHFNCTGVHSIGQQWMPSSTHGQANGQSQHKH
jgi:hypothetical protein